MQNDTLEKIVEDVESAKQKEVTHLREVLNHEIVKYKETLPLEINDEDLQNKIDIEVQTRMEEFKKNMDLNPRALYHALKVETELNHDADETHLKRVAYEFLEKNTKNKYLKKIIKDLKRRG